MRGQYGYNYLYTLHLLDSDGNKKINGIIGVRFARNCHPDDLWSSYFTSSKYVQEYRKTYGEPDVIEVRQTFNDSLQAREWEEKVIRRIDAVKSDRWLNKGNGGRAFCQTSESIERMRETKRNNCKPAWNKGKKGFTRSEESKKKQSLATKGITKSDEWKDKMKKPKSEEHNEKNRQAQIGKINVYDVNQGKCIRVSVVEARSDINRYLNTNSNKYKQIKSAKAA